MNICVYFVELLYNGLNSFGGVRETLLVFQLPGLREMLSRALSRPSFLGGGILCGLLRFGRQAAHGAGVDRRDGGVLYRQPGSLPAVGKSKPVVWDKILAAAIGGKLLLLFVFIGLTGFVLGVCLELK